MSDKKKVFGLVAFSGREELSYERQAICDQAAISFDEVLLIDPRKVSYAFVRGQKRPEVYAEGVDISDLSYLYVGGTRHHESSIAVLVRSLHLCGCLINDPVDRFSIGYASKLLSTIKRFSKGVGSTSYFAFDPAQARFIVSRIQGEDAFPLIAKPIAGKKGKGVELLNDLEATEAYIQQFFKARKDADVPVFFQKYVPFVSEYRIMLNDKQVLGVARKVPAEGKVAANAAQGGRFVKESRPDMEAFLLENISSNGLYGVDIAEDAEVYSISLKRIGLLCGLNLKKQPD
ncbi:MAG: hypothetical protein R2792_06075 [Saprospiraceae bacterium]